MALERLPRSRPPPSGASATVCSLAPALSTQGCETPLAGAQQPRCRLGGPAPLCPPGAEPGRGSPPCLCSGSLGLPLGSEALGHDCAPKRGSLL